VTGDCHAPFRGSPGVRSPRATRPWPVTGRCHEGRMYPELMLTIASTRLPPACHQGSADALTRAGRQILLKQAGRSRSRRSDAANLSVQDSSRVGLGRSGADVHVPGRPREADGTTGCHRVERTWPAAGIRVVNTASETASGTGKERSRKMVMSSAITRRSDIICIQTPRCMGMSARVGNARRWQ